MMSLTHMIREINLVLSLSSHQILIQEKQSVGDDGNGDNRLR